MTDSLIANLMIRNLSLVIGDSLLDDDVDLDVDLEL